SSSLFHASAPSEIYPLSLHDALPIFDPSGAVDLLDRELHSVPALRAVHAARPGDGQQRAQLDGLALVGATRARPSSWARCCPSRSEEHTSELQSRGQLVCRLLLEKKK